MASTHQQYARPTPPAPGAKIVEFKDVSELAPVTGKWPLAPGIWHQEWLDSSGNAVEMPVELTATDIEVTPNNYRIGGESYGIDLLYSQILTIVTTHPDQGPVSIRFSSTDPRVLNAGTGSDGSGTLVHDGSRDGSRDAIEAVEKQAASPKWLWWVVAGVVGLYLWTNRDKK